jgi:glycosyltransferase involved in cell wall biosynthesis
VNGPKISVVMSVYNGEKYLAEAINSILQQTYSDFEFIIIDDGSTDGSLKIIRQFVRDESRIVLISRENKGLVKSLNEGIRLSKGEYIARMDADDISMPNRFEKQVKLMEREELHVCGCHFYVVDENNRYKSTRILSTSSVLNKFILCRTVPFAHGSVMIRKEFIVINRLLYGMTNYYKAEDYALWLEFNNKGARISNVNDFLFKYRDLDGSLSKQKMNSEHAYALSKIYCKERKSDLFKVFENEISSFNELNEIEKEHISYFLLKNIFSGYFSNLWFLKEIPFSVNIKNLLKIMMSK